MNAGKYIFSQMTAFLPKRYFERLVERVDDKTRGWCLSYWNQLLVLMFGQLCGCRSLRELTDITTAHATKSFHLGFGRIPVTRSVLSRANTLRNYHVFEKFAYRMVEVAQGKRIDKEFDLYGRFYAFDSTTIDLCMSVFQWAKFRSTKSGIKVHTMLDVVTEIPPMFAITEAAVNDVNAMDWIPYDPLACYIFDRGYWDLARLFHIEEVGSFFVIREKSHPGYEVVEGEDMLDGKDGVLRDQTIRFTGKRNKTNYPSVIRRIVYYAEDLKRTFTFYTNNFYLSANNIAFLYKNRWKVELFFKFIKQHLRVKTFWGNTENAVRIQIYTAISTYCLAAIIEHALHLNRNVNEVLRILGSSMLTKDDIVDLFLHQPEEIQDTTGQWVQLEINFDNV